MEKHAIFLAFFMAAILQASATTIDATDIPTGINFHEAPKELSFNLKNNAAYRINVEVSLALPIEYETIKSSKWIDAGKSSEFSYRLTPKESLKGELYTGTIFIRTADEEIKKKIVMTFGNLSKEEITMNSDYREENMRIIITGEIQNNSISERTISFTGITDLPKGWTVEEMKPLAISANGGKKKFAIGINPDSNYSGNLILGFTVKGTPLKIENTVGIVDYRMPAQGNSDAVGLVVANSMAGIEDNLFTVNIILAIACALLLVAFTARLVKRTGNKATQGDRHEEKIKNAISFGQEPSSGHGRNSMEEESPINIWKNPANSKSGKYADLKDIKEKIMGGRT